MVSTEAQKRIIEGLAKRGLTVTEQALLEVAVELQAELDKAQEENRALRMEVPV
jgi:hypothetical protein